MSKLAWTLIAAAALVTLTACGGSKNGSQPGGNVQPSGTAAATAKSTPQANTTGTPKPSPTPFVGGRDPVEGSLGTASATPSPGELADVRAAGQNGYDRITFEFRGAPPNYRVEYVTAPAQCASGAPVPLTGQQAALQVKFTPAAAHNAQSTPTVSQTSINPGLPSIVAAQQTCDFEADVTWVVILNQKVDFRVLALTDPYRLAVDVAQP